MKERLDILLVKRGLAPSREKAKAMIMEGNVFVKTREKIKQALPYRKMQRLRSKEIL